MLEPVGRRPVRKLALAVAGLLALAAPARAQVVTTTVNRDGVSLPCVTVGPLAFVAQEYCVKRTLDEGFVRKNEVGVSGLTIGRVGAQDGVVAAVAPGSPAASAGLAPGDRLVSVDGAPVRRTSASVARQLAFGARAETVRLSLRRAGAPLERAFVRGAAPEPAGTPKSPNMLLGMHPMVDWQGIFVPCMGAGPLGPAVIGTCLSHYRQDGFVRVSALGSTGLTFEDARDGTAVVAAVEPGSPAAAADVQVGDTVTAVDARPLTASSGRAADALLFGKAGAAHRLMVDHNGRSVAADLVLAAR